MIELVVSPSIYLTFLCVVFLFCSCGGCLFVVQSFCWRYGVVVVVVVFGRGFIF